MRNGSVVYGNTPHSAADKKANRLADGRADRQKADRLADRRAKGQQTHRQASGRAKGRQAHKQAGEWAQDPTGSQTGERTKKMRQW